MTGSLAVEDLCNAIFLKEDGEKERERETTIYLIFVCFQMEGPPSLIYRLLSPI